jgi:formate dehydrogenase
LIATLDGERVLSLKPDRDHPLSQGHVCRKGTQFAAIHHHPSRVSRPLLRDGATWVEAGWDVALDRLGGQLRALRDAHGPESIGLYLGNAAGSSLGSILGATALQRGLGTTKSYSCLTLDNSEMFVVTEACLGNPMLTFVADYAGSDCVVLIGTDPLSSQPSQAQSHPTGIRELLGKAGRGQLVVVDPRPSATARRAALHLRPRPGSDAALLAHLVREALARTARWRSDALLDPRDVAELGSAVAPFDRSRTAAETGLLPTLIADLCDRLLAAERPLVWSGLGVLLGPDGTLGYWLTLALQAVLGGLDVAGGWIHQRGAVDLPKLFSRLGVPGRDPKVRSRIGGYPAILGTLAAATLADDVLTPGPGQLRALVVVGGNPAISLPDAPRAQEALRALELLISVDLFVNDTGSLSHAVLPAADWLERDDVDLHLASQRRLPHLQFTPAVVAPRGEARTDFAILTGLAHRAGVPLFGSRLLSAAFRTLDLGPVEVARAVVATHAPFGWGALRAAPRGLVARGNTPGALRRRGTDLPGGRIRLAVPELVDALVTDPLGVPSPAADGVVRLQLLTSVRPVETMNSWMHDQPGAGRREPVAQIHPEDLARLGLPDGGRVRLRPDGAATWSVEVGAVGAPGLRPGTVVLPYGWGHLPGAIGAATEAGPGVNANALVSTARLERFTGQPISHGLWIEALAQ